MFRRKDDTRMVKIWKIGSSVKRLEIFVFGFS